MKDRVRGFYFQLFKSQFKNIGVELSIVEERWDWYVQVEWSAHINAQPHSGVLRSDYLTDADEERVQIILHSLVETMKRRMMYELLVVERAPKIWRPNGQQ